MIFKALQTPSFIKRFMDNQLVNYVSVRNYSIFHKTCYKTNNGISMRAEQKNSWVKRPQKVHKTMENSSEKIAIHKPPIKERLNIYRFVFDFIGVLLPLNTYKQ